MKKLIVFLTFLFVFGGCANSSLDSQEGQTEQRQLLYNSFKAQHPYHIIIKKGEKIIDLKRDWQGPWLLVNSDNNLANEEAVNKLVEVILTAIQKEVVSSNPQDWADFDVIPEKGIEVIIKERKDREIAHFWVGKTEKFDAGQYVRKNNLDEVILIDQILTSYLILSLDIWKNKVVFQ